MVSAEAEASCLGTCAVLAPIGTCTRAQLSCEPDITTDRRTSVPRDTRGLSVGGGDCTFNYHFGCLDLKPNPVCKRPELGYGSSLQYQRLQNRARAEAFCASLLAHRTKRRNAEMSVLHAAPRNDRRSELVTTRGAPF